MQVCVCVCGCVGGGGGGDRWVGTCVCTDVCTSNLVCVWRIDGWVGMYVCVCVGELEAVWH